MVIQETVGLTFLETAPPAPLALTEQGGPLNASDVDLIRIAVRDFEAVTAAYEDLLGPALVEEAVQEDWTWYNGRYSNVSFRLSSFPMGPPPSVRLEIVSPLNSESSFTAELLRANGPFFSHMGVDVPDLGQARMGVEALGCPTVQRGQRGTTCYAMVDCRESLGAVLELKQEGGSCPYPDGAPPLLSQSLHMNRQRRARTSDPILNPTMINHVCVVMEDFNRSAAAFGALFGVEAPKGLHSPKGWQYYRGQPTDEAVMLQKAPIGPAAAAWGLEFVAPINDEPSFFWELLHANGPFFHHIGANVPEGTFDGKLAKFNAMGLDTVQLMYSDVSGNCIAYLDGRNIYGTPIEIVGTGNCRNSSSATSFHV